MTHVESITENGIEVLVPLANANARPLEPGTPVDGSYDYRRGRLRFTSVVLAAGGDGQILSIALPETIESVDRRRAYRLETLLDPLCIFRLVVGGDADGERDVVVRGQVVDLSEGGLCLSTRARVVAGEWLGLQADLPDEGELVVRMRVVRVVEPASGYRNRHVHCSFAGVSQLDADRIARYLLRRQMRMRQRGQL
jgi:c-di-GMP-binding flagellar brake protein YcgR